MKLEKDIFFYHVMKTAGTTVVRLFEDAYGAESVCALPTHQQADDSSFLQKASADFPLVVTGHPDHLFHLWEHAHKRTGPRFQMVFMRNPIDRYLSCYYFWTRSKYVNAHVDACNLSLEESLECDRLQFTDNLMTKSLASLGKQRDYSIKANAEDFKAAFENLKQMQFIGIFEHLHLSCSILADVLGYPMPVLPAWNVNDKYPGKNECDKIIVRKIMTKNIYDLELYNAALNLFYLQAAECGEKVKEILKSLGHNNKIYKVKQK